MSDVDAPDPMRRRSRASDVWGAIHLPDATLIVTDEALIRRGGATSERWSFDLLEAVMQDGRGRHIVLFRTARPPLVLDVDQATQPEEARQALTVLQLLLARHQRQRPTQPLSAHSADPRTV